MIRTSGIPFGKRKFYKINSLYGVFLKVNNETTYKTTITYGYPGTCFEPDFLQEYGDKIDEHTILFITASDKDDGKFVKIIPKNVIEGEDSTSYEDAEPVLHKLKQGDTLIWARGDVYSVSTKSVSEIKKDEIDNSKLIVTYTDGATETIIPNPQLPYSGTYPVNVNTSNRNISLQDISINQYNRNIIFNSDKNGYLNGVNYAHVEGHNNTANASYQHIEGRYADIKNTYAFIIGDGNLRENSNLFVIRFDGYVFTKGDFTSGGTIDNPLYKLSDIHSVLDVDWAFIGSDENDNSFNDTDFSTTDYL